MNKDFYYCWKCHYNYQACGVGINAMQVLRESTRVYVNSVIHFWQDEDFEHVHLNCDIILPISITSLNILTIWLQLDCKLLGFKEQRVHQQTEGTEISQCTFQTGEPGHSPKNQVHRILCRNLGISAISAEQSMCNFSDKEERQGKI